MEDWDQHKLPMGIFCCDGVSLFTRCWALTEGMGKSGLAEKQSVVQWTFISPVSIFYWTPEAFWKSLSRATASMSIPHSRVWHKVNGDPKAYIQEHNYSAFGLSPAHMEHSLWIPCSTAKRPISGISALIGLYLMTLSSGIVSAIRTAYEHQGVLWFLRNRNGPFLYILHSQAHLILIMYKPGKSLTGLFVCK